MRLMVKDHLGSLVARLDKDGKMQTRHRFDAFGQQHNIDTSALSRQPITERLPVTQRGFGGHEMLANMDIVHMNGRIYDPVVGRFLQADPFVQAPKNLQNLNRYSYVLNNPLSYTDPSGYFFNKLGKSIKKNWRTIAAIGIAGVACMGLNCLLLLRPMVLPPL